MSAVLSECGQYRYLLTRHIAQPYQPGTTVTFVMLNPSTADATTDDPTIRRCMGFARDWGFEKLMVVNLFAYRATKPSNLPDSDEAIGPENALYLLKAIKDSEVVIAAWGAHERARGPALVVREFCDMIDRRLECLGKNKDGSPKHPLYVRADTELVPW